MLFIKKWLGSKFRIVHIIVLILENLGLVKENALLQSRLLDYEVQLESNKR